MGKICDPPPFAGGQCPVVYAVTMTGSVRHDSWTWQPSVSIERATGLNPYTRGYIGSIVSIDPVVISTTCLIRIVHNGGNTTTHEFIAGYGEGTFWESFSVVSIVRQDNQHDDCGDPPPINCRCSDDSCRVDCAGAPDGFCCIDHSLTNRLLQTLQN